MEIKKGDKFICIADVQMDSEETVYVKDKEYLSEMDNCITNDLGERDHSWSWSTGDDLTDHPDLYFKKMEPEPDEKSLIPYLPTAAEIYKLHPLPNQRPMKEVVETVLKIARLLRDGDTV